MDKILLIGAGGHANACIEIIECNKKFKIIGLIAKKGVSLYKISPYTILGDDNDLTRLREVCKNALVSVGQIKSPQIRIKLYDRLKELSFKLPVIISPRAHVSRTAQIGEGSIIMHGAIINSNAKIGKNCIINTNALIEHDALVGNHCHISTGSIINGKTSIGSKTFVGSGGIILQSISIGEDCIIGAGAIIKKDISSYKVIKN
jgi:sugar O-acyltransferase (sialic acid O-acetyltransferase NeuD family)